MSKLFAVEDLTFTINTKRRLFKKPKPAFNLGPVTFSINQGETLAIIGDNGSGKSLLAKLLVGATKPTSGAVYLNGHQLQTQHLRQRCLHVRMIFQHSSESLNPSVTLGSILEEPLRLNTELTHSERAEKVKYTLSQVGLLPEHRYFYRHMLSDGQRQRVALARALILDPQVIVADEPFAALDPSVRSQTVNLIMRLQRELGLGFIFISHNLGIVRHISDKILVMQHGQVIEQGKTDVIFNWPKNDYTNKLVHSHQSLLKGQI